MIVGSSLLLIGGLALVPASAPAGAVLAVMGILWLGGFLIYAYIRAYQTGQGDRYTPGKGYREVQAERKAAAERQAAEERRSR
jgi:hypothetical protein